MDSTSEEGTSRRVLTDADCPSKEVEFGVVAEVISFHDLDSSDDANEGKDQNIEDTHEKHEFVAGVLEEFMLQHRQKEGEIRQLR